MYLFDLLGGGLEDSRCVSGGLIVSEQIGKLYIIGRKLAFESSLKSGVIGKVYDVISEERIDSCPTARVTSRIAAGIKKVVNPLTMNEEDVDEELLAHQSLLISETENPKEIYVDDDITAATSGKQLLISVS